MVICFQMRKNKILPNNGVSLKICLIFIDKCRARSFQVRMLSFLLLLLLLLLLVSLFFFFVCTLQVSASSASQDSVKTRKREWEILGLPSQCSAAVMLNVSIGEAYRALSVSALAVLKRPHCLRKHWNTKHHTTFLALGRIASIRPFLSNSFTERFVVFVVTS